jgi:hypothetical protein
MSSPDPSHAQAFQVVVLYDHSQAARLGLTAYSHLSRELESEFVLNLHIWRIDVAVSSDYAADANADIARADMVILAVRDRKACVAACLHWTGKADCFDGKRRQALVAIIDSEQEISPATATWSDDLQSTFEKTQADVFFWQLPSRTPRPTPTVQWDGATPGITP